MTKRYLPLLAWLAVAGLPSAALAQPVGPEFQVNSYATNFQGRPAIASDASGNFVVVWWSASDDNIGVFGQRYDNEGNRLGSDFHVNTSPITYFTNYNSAPSVTTDASGNFVVVWQRYDGVIRDIVGQRYDSGGTPLGGEFLVTPGVSWTKVPHYSQKRHPSVSSDTSGNFVVVWEVFKRSVYGQRYDNHGIPQGTPFAVPTDPRGYKGSESVASNASGNFVVVWEHHYQGPYYSFHDASGQRFDSNGDRVGSEFPVGKTAFERQHSPSVAWQTSGDFVVVWSEHYHVYGQRYDMNSPVGDLFQVSTCSKNANDAYASVASDSKGNFVVVWQAYARDDHDGSSNGIFGQRFDKSAKPIGEEFQINTYTTSSQDSPGVASDSKGNFVVVWESQYQDGGGGGNYNDFGVFGQRFSVGCRSTVLSPTSLCPANPR